MLFVFGIFDLVFFERDYSRSLVHECTNSLIFFQSIISRKLIPFFRQFNIFPKRFNERNLLMAGRIFRHDKDSDFSNVAFVTFFFFFNNSIAYSRTSRVRRSKNTFVACVAKNCNNAQYRIKQKEYSQHWYVTIRGLHLLHADSLISSCGGFIMSHSNECDLLLRA